MIARRGGRFDWGLDADSLDDGSSARVIRRTLTQPERTRAARTLARWASTHAHVGRTIWLGCQAHCPSSSALLPTWRAHLAGRCCRRARARGVGRAARAAACAKWRRCVHARRRRMRARTPHDHAARARGRGAQPLRRRSSSRVAAKWPCQPRLAARRPLRTRSPHRRRARAPHRSSRPRHHRPRRLATTTGRAASRFGTAGRRPCSPCRLHCARPAHRRTRPLLAWSRWSASFLTLACPPRSTPTPPSAPPSATQRAPTCSATRGAAPPPRRSSAARAAQWCSTGARLSRRALCALLWTPRWLRRAWRSLARRCCAG
jgi:hypothetical protein